MKTHEEFPSASVIETTQDAGHSARLGGGALGAGPAQKSSIKKAYATKLGMIPKIAMNGIVGSVLGYKFGFSDCKIPGFLFRS